MTSYLDVAVLAVALIVAGVLVPVLARTVWPMPEPTPKPEDEEGLAAEMRQMLAAIANAEITRILAARGRAER